jgi:uncharacterized membrane protein YphA (DoxX/SURF4 family)
MRRAAWTLALSLALIAVSATAAFAHDGGEGTYGPTDDRVVTYAGFILIGFFPLLVFLLSMLQWSLDKRKDRRKAAAKARRARADLRGGW